ncbi:hypothetical protein CsSME_00018905 [Camellia sinensis var. sinensis]
MRESENEKLAVDFGRSSGSETSDPFLSLLVISSGKREYAGSAFSVSPSPRSVPLPSFFSKKQLSKVAIDGDSATRDLRRLLQLD